MMNSSVVALLWLVNVFPLINTDRVSNKRGTIDTQNKISASL